MAPIYLNGLSFISLRVHYELQMNNDYSLWKLISFAKDYVLMSPQAALWQLCQLEHGPEYCGTYSESFSLVKLIYLGLNAEIVLHLFITLNRSVCQMNKCKFTHQNENKKMPLNWLTSSSTQVMASHIFLFHFSFGLFVFCEDK